jgi:uncharacterized protein YjbJ (UPF0337 family)
MNKDQVSGKADQVSGKIKQKVGEAVGNQNLANRGAAEQVKGAVKETWGNAKDAAHETAETRKREADMRSNESRENFTQNVQTMKHRVNDSIDEHKDREKQRRPA